MKKQPKTWYGKTWYFIWEDDSILSWIVNIVLAFVIIKFLVYPGLGFLLGTTHPIVAVVSSSMEHKGFFDDYWENGGQWYEENGISKEMFKDFPMHNGFNKGDIMILKGADIENIEVGEIIVYNAKRPAPIIHRVVTKNRINNDYVLETKGDNYLTNPTQIRTPSLDETNVRDEQIIGKALIRVPFLGYIKIWFVELICLFNNDLSFCIIG
jgi:hypothetical protein